MRLTDYIINKFGADKLLHLCIAGWAVSLASSYGTTGMIVTTILVAVMSIVKELWLDNKTDWYDFGAAIIGILLSWLFHASIIP